MFYVDDEVSLKEVVERYCVYMFHTCNGNKTHATNALDITKRTLHNHLSRYVVQHPEFEHILFQRRAILDTQGNKHMEKTSDDDVNMPSNKERIRHLDEMINRDTLH